MIGFMIGTTTLTYNRFSILASVFGWHSAIVILLFSRTSVSTVCIEWALCYKHPNLTRNGFRQNIAKRMWKYKECIRWLTINDIMSEHLLLNFNNWLSCAKVDSLISFSFYCWLSQNLMNMIQLSIQTGQLCCKIYMAVVNLLFTI